MDVLPGNALVKVCNSIIPERKDNSIVAVNEIYLDGKLKKAELICENDKSYGIFMHSLALSSYAEIMRIDGCPNLVGDEYEKAIYSYTASKGFNKNFIETIAPRVNDLSFKSEDSFKTSAHLINEKLRIVSKGTPEELLKRCSYVLMDSKLIKITRRIIREITGVLNDMISRCLFVYAIAIKDISRIPQTAGVKTYINDMTLVALVGMGR